MPRCSVRSSIPETAFACVTSPEVCHVFSVVGISDKIVNLPGEMLAGLKMAGGVPVALVLGGIEREINHRPQHQRGGERMTLLECVSGRGQ